MRYRIIGIDLDSTLLDAEGQLSEENRAAVRAAQDTGAIVVPCTGRGWVESKQMLGGVPGLGLGVFVTGAVVFDIAAQRVAHLSPIDPSVALEVINHLRDLPDAVLVFCHAERAGHDYLVTGNGRVSENTSWWFRLNDIAVRHQRHVNVGDLQHTLRIGCVAPDGRVRPAMDRLRAAMGGRICLHSFPAVQMPGDGQELHVLEVFAPAVDKWAGLSWIAGQAGIEVGQIAAIGDGINDLSMLAEAGCGIAMANGIDEVRSKADYVTASNDDHGVAHAIEQLLSGAWV